MEHQYMNPFTGKGVDDGSGTFLKECQMIKKQKNREEQCMKIERICQNYETRKKTKYFNHRK